jgi:hypothetical protein
MTKHKVTIIDENSVYFNISQVNNALVFKALPGTSLISFNKNTQIIKTCNGFTFIPAEDDSLKYLFIKSTYCTVYGHQKQFLLVRIAKKEGSKLSVTLQDVEYTPVCIMGDGILTVHLDETFLTTEKILPRDSRFNVSVNDICLYIAGELSDAELLNKGKAAKKISINNEAQDVRSLQAKISDLADALEQKNTLLDERNKTIAEFSAYEESTNKLVEGFKRKSEETAQELSLCKDTITSLISAANGLLYGCRKWEMLRFCRSMPTETFDAVGRMKSIIEAVAASNKSLNCLTKQ